MNIEIITKSDLQTIESKLTELLTRLNSGSLGATQIYTTKELAAKLKVSTKTINNWREDRLIEFQRIRGVILFTDAALQEFLANHSIKRKSSFTKSQNL